jgi:NADH:ubiquinone oxidoreductase subunit K
MGYGNSGEEKMSFQLVIYANLLLLLIGVFGILYSKDIVSIFVSMQLIIISGVMNFLVFSQFLYQRSLWDKIFIILGVTIIYLVMFCLVYYLYLNKDELSRETLYNNFKFFKIKKSDWWGEDNI